MTTVRRKLLDSLPGNALFHKHEFKSLDAGAVSCKMTAYTKGKRKMNIQDKVNRLVATMEEISAYGTRSAAYERELMKVSRSFSVIEAELTKSITICENVVRMLDE